MDTAPTSSDACVLIVDEDQETRHVLRLLFEFENIDVVEASNAADAFSNSSRPTDESPLLSDLMSEVA